MRRNKAWWARFTNEETKLIVDVERGVRPAGRVYSELVSRDKPLEAWWVRLRITKRGRVETRSVKVMPMPGGQVPVELKGALRTYLSGPYETRAEANAISNQVIWGNYNVGAWNGPKPGRE